VREIQSAVSRFRTLHIVTQDWTEICSNHAPHLRSLLSLENGPFLDANFRSRSSFKVQFQGPDLTIFPRPESVRPYDPWKKEIVKRAKG
jgi:hypothetical protein